MRLRRTLQTKGAFVASEKRGWSHHHPHHHLQEAPPASQSKWGAWETTCGSCESSSRYSPSHQALASPVGVSLTPDHTSWVWSHWKEGSALGVSFRWGVGWLTLGVLWGAPCLRFSFTAVAVLGPAFPCGCTSTHCLLPRGWTIGQGQGRTAGLAGRPSRHVK